jgi:hypothetical protein
MTELEVATKLSPVEEEIILVVVERW